MMKSVTGTTAKNGGLGLRAFLHYASHGDVIGRLGGLLVATVLTLLFLPALYVAWFRVKEPSSQNSD